MVDGATIGLSGQGQFAKLEIGKPDDDYQTIILKADDIFSKLDSNINKITFALYNASEQDFTITLDVKYKKQKLYKSMSEVVLASKQITYIEIPLLNINWEKSGAMDHIRFSFGNREDQLTKTLYVKDIIVFDK
jgi:hypothetical protein